MQEIGVCSSAPQALLGVSTEPGVAPGHCYKTKQKQSKKYFLNDSVGASNIEK